MPLYQYKCKRCGYEEEVLQSVNDPAPLCPVCCWNPDCSDDCETMEKQMPKHTGFILKGTGWYKTDYGHKGKMDDRKKDKKG